MWEVYLDERYEAHFETEEEAKAYCEAKGWEMEDPDWGFISHRTYGQVDVIEEARTYGGKKPPVTIDGRLYEHTGYEVSFDQKWYFEFLVDGKQEFLPTTQYSKILEEEATT